MLTISILPHVNATLNATAAVFIVAGYGFIRQKRVALHRTCMLIACGASVLFLVSYLTYHYFHGVTHFTGEAWVRVFYFTLLWTHTALAVLVVPLVSITLWRAVRGDFERHRRIARWTFPIWLYVSVTGVVVYWMLYHVFPSG